MPTSYREYDPNQGLLLPEDMRNRMETEACRAAYSARAWRSEVPNGWIKHVLGFRQFSMRRLEAARGEWNLVCMALNIRRLHGLTASAAGAG